MFDYSAIPADLREMMESQNTKILVISKPEKDEHGRPVSCSKCHMTTRALDKENIDYSLSKSLDNDEHLNFVTSVIGGTAAPAVVVIDDERNVIDAWTDFRRDSIKSINSKHSVVVAA